LVYVHMATALPFMAEMPDEIQHSAIAAANHLLFMSLPLLKYRRSIAGSFLVRHAERNADFSAEQRIQDHKPRTDVG